MMRIVANLAALLSIIFLPWWTSSIVLIIFLAMFDFVEIILYGLFLDILFGIPDNMFSRYGFVFCALIFYIVSVWIRPYFKQV